MVYLPCIIGGTLTDSDTWLIWAVVKTQRTRRGQITSPLLTLIQLVQPTHRSIFLLSPPPSTWSTSCRSHIECSIHIVLTWTFKLTSFSNVSLQRIILYNTLFYWIILGSRDFLNFLEEWGWVQKNLQSLEDTQVGYILQKYSLDKYTLEKYT